MIIKMKDFEIKDKYNIADLRRIMEILRGEGGCPWDREQTHKSIRRDLIEETYEVIEAIDTDDAHLLEEELGDLLLQVVFHARISEEAGEFDLDSVADGICKKLILRHPHVFGDLHVDSSGEVLDNWEKIKKEEKQRNTLSENLRAIPPMFPALMRAYKIGKKAKNFDFDSADSAYAKVLEECSEIKSAIDKADPENIKEEIGDLLFSVANMARKLGVDPEEALTRTNEKFIRRVSSMETLILADNKDMDAMNQIELDEYWDMVKRTEKGEK